MLLNSLLTPSFWALAKKLELIFRNTNHFLEFDNIKAERTSRKIKLEIFVKTLKGSKLNKYGFQISSSAQKKFTFEFCFCVCLEYNIYKIYNLSIMSQLSQQTSKSLLKQKSSLSGKSLLKSKVTLPSRYAQSPVS